MAITKRLRVSFDVKTVASTEEVEEFTKNLLDSSKRFLSGEKLTGIELELARIACQAGVEAAIELHYKSAFQRWVREELVEEGFTPANICVEVKQ